MKIFLFAALAGPSLCSLSLHESDSPRVLQLGLKRKHHNDPVGRDRQRLKRQSDTVDVDLFGDSMDGDIYSTNLTIGNPPQSVEVSVDTGSSDLWVVYSDNPICEARGARCDSLGTYDPRSSSSSDALSDLFQIQYGDNSWAEGYYGVDTVTIENAEIPELQFGVAMASSKDKGILGIGYTTNVVTTYAYPNLPALLATNNITNSNAYSLWLNRLGSDEGNILFGGINTAHFTGPLQTLPIVPFNDENDYLHLWLTLTDLTVKSSQDDIEKSYADSDSDSDDNEFPMVVLLDSGATLTYLPSDLVSQIYNDLDVHFQPQSQFAYVPCNTYLVGREDYNLTFSFSGATIRVPLRELVLQDALYYRGETFHIDDEESCLFGILPSVDFFPILGDSFLRSAYVVFDLNNNEISLAQANFDPDGEGRILEIGEGDDSVPEAEDVEDPVTTVSIVSGGSSLVIPAGHTNEPIFPSRSVTTSEATGTSTESGNGDGGTGVVETGVPGGGDSDSDSGDGTGSGDALPGDGAGILGWNPVLLAVCVVGGLAVGL